MKDQLIRDYAHVFGSEAGQRVLADIMALAHVLEPIQTLDPTELAIQAGRRDVAVSILQRMQLRSADYPRIVASTIPED